MGRQIGAESAFQTPKLFGIPKRFHCESAFKVPSAFKVQSFIKVQGAFKLGFTVSTLWSTSSMAQGRMNYKDTKTYMSAFL
jgi:hypothetical protein